MRILEFIAGIGRCGLVLVLFLLAQPANGLSSGWQQDGPVGVRVIAASDGWQDGQMHIGIVVRLDAGWKTYWRYPGAAGLPVAIDERQHEQIIV
ncbi:MAG: hypothetical protein AAF352_09490, partial [Pseudomonadota bacterium]